MTLIDPKPITPAEWQARENERVAKLMAVIGPAAAQAKSHEARHARAAIEVARRWKSYSPGKRHHHDVAVETVDGLEPKIAVHSFEEAARLCSRSPMTLYQSIQRGHRFGGRRWAKVFAGSVVGKGGGDGR